MDFEEIVKFLLFSALPKTDQFISLTRYYYAGYLTQDMFNNAVGRLNIKEFTREELQYVSQVNEATVSKMRLPNNQPGILNSGGKRFILPFDYLRSLTLDGRSSQVWSRKDFPDGRKSHIVDKKGVHRVTFMEEHGFVVLEDSYMVSRTIQPVWIESEGCLSHNSVMILPGLSEKDVMDSFPSMPVIGGGRGFYGAFELRPLSPGFRSRFGCEADQAFVCRGYYPAFDDLTTPHTPIPKFLPKGTVL